MTHFLPPIDSAALLELLIRATLLIVAAWAAAAAMRTARLSAAARHMAWLLGIAALLVLPLIWWLAPALRLPILPEAAATAAPQSAAAPPILASPLPGQWIGLLLPGYAVIAGFLLLRILIARRVLARVWREAESVPDPAWNGLFSALSRDMRLPRRVELRIAKGPAMPMTWGTLAPKVLLPAEACSWSQSRRRLVLLHELAHVARRDSLSRSVASLACALYWFHPGAWFAARRMFMEQEHAADDRVLAAGGSARAYAQSLLHLATPAGDGFRPAHAAGMAGMYQLECRLVSIINPARRDPPTAFFLSSSALLASLATLIVAAGVPVSVLSVPLDSVGAEPVGIVSSEIVPGPRASVLEAGGTLERREAELRNSADESGPRQGPDYARSLSGERRLQSDSGARAGSEQAGEPAQPADPATPTIQMRRESFTLSAAASPQAGFLGGLPPLRRASGEPSARPAPIEEVPRSFAVTAPDRERRQQSARRTRFVLEVVRGVPVEL